MTPLELFSIISASIGIILAIISIVLNENEGAIKKLILSFSCITIISFLLTLVFAFLIIGKVQNALIVCMAVFAIIASVAGVISLITAIIAKALAKNNGKSNNNRDSNSIDYRNVKYDDNDDEIKALLAQVASKHEHQNSNQIILYSSANTGVGLWTSICIVFASIFGVESKNYKKKMNKVIEAIKLDLHKQMSELKDYEFSDYRIVKEKGLAYYGTVIGNKKSN